MKYHYKRTFASKTEYKAPTKPTVIVRLDLNINEEDNWVCSCDSYRHGGDFCNEPVSNEGDLCEWCDGGHD